MRVHLLVHVRTPAHVRTSCIGKAALPVRPLTCFYVDSFDILTIYADGPIRWPSHYANLLGLTASGILLVIIS